MQKKSNPVLKSLEILLTDLRSIRGVIGRIPQLIGIILLFGLLSPIIHKIYIDIALTAEQYPSDFWKELAILFLNRMAGG